MTGQSKSKMAQEYARLGLSVAPMRRNTIREVRINADHPEMVKRAWQKWPGSNVAIRTGAPSKLVVIEVGPSRIGFEFLRAFERTYTPLPDTVQSMRGNGRLQYYFTYEGPFLSATMQMAPFIRPRADDGYVIAPPSKFPPQWPSAWLPGKAPWEFPVAPLPAWLLDHIRDRRPDDKILALLKPYLDGAKNGTSNPGVVTAPLATGTIAAIEGLATSSSSTSEKGSS